MATNLPSVERNDLLQGVIDRAISEEQQLKSYRKITDRLFQRQGVRGGVGQFREKLLAYGGSPNIVDMRRAPGTSYKDVIVRYGTVAGWDLEDVGLGWSVDKKEILRGTAPANDYDIHGDHMMDTVINVELGRAHGAVQLAISSAITNSQTVAAGDKVSDTTSDQIAFIQTERTAFLGHADLYPTGIFCNIEYAEYLANHPQMVEFWSRTQASLGRMVEGSPTGGGHDAYLMALEAFVARAWKVEEAIVTDARYNSANVNQTASTGWLLDDDAVLFHKGPQRSAKSPMSCMTRFQGEGSTVVDGETISWEEGYVSTGYDRRTKSFQGEYSYDEHFTIPRPLRGRRLLDIY